MKRLLLFLTLLYSTSCDTGQPANGKEGTPSNINIQDTSESDSSMKEMPSYNSKENQDALFGVWISDNQEQPTIDINKDSIYYTEHFESYKYDLKGDSIFIKYPDFIFSAKVLFNKDTLIMESENGHSKFYRFKE